MFSEVLKTSNSRLSKLQCCKHDGSACNCVSCLQQGFSTNPDSYDCEKKMCTYVLRYGPSYASEIYNYLTETNFVEKIDTTKPLNIYSLGCGFSPDFFAFKKYFEVSKIKAPINYIGIDSSTCWNTVRPVADGCSYFTHDLRFPFSIESPDVVIVSKVFSTLYRNEVGAATAFLNSLKLIVDRDFKPSTILIFVEVNHVDFGRDFFHRSVRSFLPNFKQYYFDGYTGDNWVPLSRKGNVFKIPSGLRVQALTGVGKTVVFEYRK